MGKAKRSPAINDWRVLAKSIGDAIIQEMKGSSQMYATYGHSFGSLLSFLTVTYIREQNGPMPVSFMVGAKNAPIQFKEPLSATQKKIHDFSRDEMKEFYMKNFAHGAPKGYLDIPGILDTILPPLQMDLGINQLFYWDALTESEKRPLDVPVHAFYGNKDDRYKENDLLNWEKHAGDAFHFHHYSGNHFFLHDDQNVFELLDDFKDILGQFV